MSNKSRYLIGTAVLIVLLGIVARRLWFPGAQEPGYQFVQAWGGPGTGPGEFNNPIGIAIAGDEVFVSDAGNNRIQIFERSGQFLRQFGQEGGDLGELSRPMHLDIQNNKLYVAEYLNDRVQIFTLQGESFGIVGSSGAGPGQFDAPGGVAVAADGRLYVADFYNYRVQFLRPNGQLIRQYGITGEKGIWAGLFNYPTDVALLPNGDLLVADAYNDRIQVFGSDGTFLRKWGGPLAINIPGSAYGWFNVATGLAVSPDGNIFVADFYNDRIQKFTPEGEFLVSFGSKGGGPGQFDRPTDMALDHEGNVYVVDFGNNRIQKFAAIPNNLGDACFWRRMDPRIPPTINSAQVLEAILFATWADG